MSLESLDIFKPASPDEVEARRKKWAKENPYVGYSGFSGYTGIQGYSGVAGYSGYPLRGFSGSFEPIGQSYIQTMQTIAKTIDDSIIAALEDFNSGPTYEKKPFKITIPKEIYYVFGIVAAAGITLFILRILEGYLKGR
jgi:hypothetical protein